MIKQRGITMKNTNDQVPLTMYLHDQLGKIKICKEKLFSQMEILFSEENELADCKVDDETRKILLNNIRRRLTPQAVKCRAGQSQKFL